MAPQYFSLHPAWDRMYASGMSVREITDYTGAPRSTVQRHLHVREQYSEDLRAVHEAAKEACGPGWPATQWRHTYKALHDFYAQHGRLPHIQTENENALARWVSQQRLLHIKGQLSGVKVALMNTIPGWDIHPHHQALDDNWRECLNQLVQYVNQTGRTPRWRRHTSEHERVLGVWLHTQNQNRTKGELLQWRLEALNETLPGWRSTM